MSFVMPEVAMTKLIDYGIKQLRKDRAAFESIFTQFTDSSLNNDYGQTYLDEIWLWFATTKIPVIKAWSFNAQVIPCISIHLATETEAEDKSAIGDIAYVDELGDETGVGVFTVMLDIGIHANRAGDHILWLYYITSYILFRYKLMAESMGLRLQTFSASDYNKDANRMTENIWTRWIRFRCTTQNFWTPFTTDELIEDINTDMAVGLEEASSLSTSYDVDPSNVDTTASNGIIASSMHDLNNEEDINL